MVNSQSSIERIAVLLTCYNRREKTLACLQALYAQKLPQSLNFDVFLVDDGCTDGTGGAVREQFPNVDVLKGDGNLYWCGGMRFAWSEAMKEDYDAYLWLNDDTILLAGALETMIATADEVSKKERRDGIIVGSCCDPVTGEHTYGGRVKRNRRSRLPDQPMPPRDHVLPCDTMNGNLVLVPRNVFNQLGNFSEPYIHAFGDTDYGMRAKKRGIPIRVAPGHLGLCAANTRVALWTNPTVPLASRWRDMRTPRGLPPKHWFCYVRRHAGIMWPIYLAKPFIRLMFPGMWNKSGSSKSFTKIRVGMFGSYYPNYRLAVFNQLAADDRILLSVHTSRKPRSGFSLIDSSAAHFNLVDGVFLQIKIPMLDKYLYFTPDLISSIIKGKYDVIVIPNRMTDITAWVGLLLAKVMGRHICLWGHGFTSRDGKLSLRLRKLMMELACANILYGERGREKSIGMGLAPEKLFVAYNALDTKSSKRLQESVSITDLNFFSKTNKIENRKILLFTGRLQERKKPDVLVRAMHMVSKEFPSALALIIGDGEMRLNLKALITELNLEAYVWLLGPIFDEELLAKYFMCSYVAVMPAHAGLAIQHAFGYGVPIIVGDNMAEHPPEVELIKHGQTGLFVKDGDANEFAKAIIGLLVNKKERQRMADNCSRLIRDKYNVESMTAKFSQAFFWAIYKNRK